MPQVRSSSVLELPDKIGALGPVYNDLYKVSNLLEYYFSTTPGLAGNSPYRYSKQSQMEESILTAWYNSWTDFNKTATVSLAALGGSMLPIPGGESLGRKAGEFINSLW